MSVNAKHRSVSKSDVRSMAESHKKYRQCLIAIGSTIVIAGLAMIFVASQMANWHDQGFMPDNIGRGVMLVIGVLGFATVVAFGLRAEKHYNDAWPK